MVYNPVHVYCKWVPCFSKVLDPGGMISPSEGLCSQENPKFLIPVAVTNATLGGRQRITGEEGFVPGTLVTLCWHDQFIWSAETYTQLMH